MADDEDSFLYGGGGGGGGDEEGDQDAVPGQETAVRIYILRTMLQKRSTSD